MSHRLAIPLVCILALATALAQGTGAWRIESDFDLYSYGGLGSIWLPALRAPADLAADDALLVVGCDPGAPLGFEIAAWVAPSGTFPLGSDMPDVAVQVRFDQDTVLSQTWFLAEGFFATEAVAYFGLNEVLFEALTGASSLTLRLEADAARGIDARTFEYAVRGFGPALAELRCGQSDAVPFDGPDGADASVIGDWAFDGSDGMVAQSDLGVLAVYCSAPDSGDANGIEIEVGDYALAAATYDVVFRSGSVDFLRTTATRNAFDAAQLDGDDVEDRLVRFLRGVLDVTVTLTPRPAGAPTKYTVPTTGFNDAFARLGCYQGGR